eukprot:m.326363 g.326363  ORF g.326363 m.326363 type:complete len:413 (-) comp16021_c0_seq7:3291-4529(-)
MAALRDDQVAKFFNDMELSDNVSDLYLLVEAEKRGLLNDTCKQILAEARKRGWIAPKPGTEEVLNTYVVRYLGGATIGRAADIDGAVSPKQVAQTLSKITDTPRIDHSTPLVLEVRSHVLQAFDVLASQSRERSSTTTLKKLKQLTLRRLTGQKRDLEDQEVLGMSTENALLVTEHSRHDIVTFLAFDKFVTCIVEEDDPLTAEKMLLCHAYKCREKSKAIEIADHLRTSHRTILKVDQERRQKLYPTERITLECPGGNAQYGFHMLGPTSHVEATTGVFIYQIDEGTIASRHPMIKIGLQIVAVNGTNTEEATLSECRELIRMSPAMIVLDLRENPYGYGMHQYRMGQRQPTVQYSGRGAVDLDAELEVLLDDLLAFSTSSMYISPVYIENNNAVLSPSPKKHRASRQFFK